MLDKESDGYWKTVIVSKEMHELRQKNKQLADQISKIIITKF
jgi:hypothetical protein